jgi:hypothetical protein
MSGMFAPDGCVLPNIPTYEYTFVFTPKCEHVKVRSAEFTIRAYSAESAARLATEVFVTGVSKGSITLVGEGRRVS